MEYQKPWLSYEQQADRLEGRGLVFDRDDLIEHLADVGYYRLSGYWYIFKKTPEGGLRTFSCTSYTGRRRDARYSSGVIHPSPCEILPERNHRIQESRAPMNSPRAAPLQSRA